jgi:MoaA/NifB/PqqE/SkfB family radical SAM enzyme
MQDKFCFAPWAGLDIDAQGNINPCCAISNMSNISKPTLTEFLSSKELFKLKEDFLNGIQPECCTRCWSAERAGLQSQRTSDLAGPFSTLTRENIDNVKHTSINIAITGNTCNLACRSCDSFASSKWGEETAKLTKILPLDNFTKLTQIYPHSKFYKDAQFWESIKTVITDDIALIQFQGGEPFVPGITKHLEFLEFLLTKNPKNIKLRYITNTTTFPSEEFWDIWSKSIFNAVLMGLKNSLNIIGGQQNGMSVTQTL